MAGRTEPVILLAEDDENDVLMFRRAFTQLGITAPIQVVPNGDEAIAYLQGSGRFSNREEFPLPDIFLLDLKMPRRNGFEVLEWLRNEPRFSAIRVIVLTTSRDIYDITRAYQLGAASFLVKPIEFTEFRNAMNAVYSYWTLNRSGEASRRPTARSGRTGSPEANASHRNGAGFMAGGLSDRTSGLRAHSIAVR
ncbi:MAG: response regulator [Verrucomicrobia subdivision 3 bacterium]|nr:response regulator [Limisphaerales bacterium]